MLIIREFDEEATVIYGFTDSKSSIASLGGGNLKSATDLSNFQRYFDHPPVYLNFLNGKVAI